MWKLFSIFERETEQCDCFITIYDAALMVYELESCVKGVYILSNFEVLSQ
jgi:hypothetical protein